MTAGMLVPEGGPRYLVKGSRGELVTKGMDPQEDQLRAGMSPGDANYGFFSGGWSTLICSVGNENVPVKLRGSIEAYRGEYPLFYKNIASAIGQKEELLVQPEEAANVISVLENAAQFHVDAVRDNQ